MHIIYNGQPLRTEASTLAELIAERIPGAGPETGGLAAAIDGQVIPRDQWDRPLSPGDTVDVLTAVQGG